MSIFNLINLVKLTSSSGIKWFLGNCEDLWSHVEANHLPELLNDGIKEQLKRTVCLVPVLRPETNENNFTLAISCGDHG